MTKDEEIELLKMACNEYKLALNDALFEIKVYRQKFQYISEGGSFYLSTAAEGMRLANSFLKQFGYDQDLE